MVLIAEMKSTHAELHFAGSESKIHRVVVDKSFIFVFWKIDASYFPDSAELCPIPLMMYRALPAKIQNISGGVGGGRHHVNTFLGI